jgi:bis(5'-nucleosyl)-tetraphosphatase (symmetrical)
VPRVFVGDVQGCAAELEELIERVRGDCGADFELWFVGDLVNRGPSSLAVLRRVRDLVESGRGRTVLGNHELHLLRVFWGQRELGATDTFRDVLEAPDARDWMEWLRRRPLLERGALDGQPFAVLHAAAHPDWELDPLERRVARVCARLAAPDPGEARALLAADPRRDAERDLLGRVTTCRSVAGAGWSSAVPATPGDAWHARWHARGHDWGIVYGHWALQGLHVAPGLRGLDTGCVHHGRDHDGFLTAWSPECAPSPSGARPFDVPDERFVQVRAHRRYRPVESAQPRATNA